MWKRTYVAADLSAAVPWSRPYLLVHLHQRIGPLGVLVSGTVTGAAEDDPMRRVMAVPIVVGLLLTTGCTVTGKWSLTKVEPEAARRNFEFASLTLQQDGSYYAETQEPHIRTTSGTYTYKDGTLTLMPHEGPRVAYDAKQPDADHLHLMKTFDGQKVKTEFKRIE